jgi:hypothetical protein
MVSEWVPASVLPCSQSLGFTCSTVRAVLAGFQHARSTIWKASGFEQLLSTSCTGVSAKRTAERSYTWQIATGQTCG